jgi:hypothetical protein
MLRGKKRAPIKTGESCPDLRRPQGSFVQCGVWARSPVLPETMHEQGLRSDFDFGQRALDFVESDPAALGAQACPVSLPLGALALSVGLMRQKGVETVFAWGQVRLRQQRRGGHAAHHVLGGEQRRLRRQPRLVLAPAAEVVLLVSSLLRSPREHDHDRLGVERLAVLVEVALLGQRCRDRPQAQIVSKRARAFIGAGRAAKEVDPS